MKTFVVDTNFFFNTQTQSGFGDNPRECIRTFTSLAGALEKAGVAQFYMPPRIVDEIETFIPLHDSDVVALLSVVNVKSPNIEQVHFPGSAFYDLVDEIRQRSYRGLTIAEEELITAVKTIPASAHDDKVVFQKTIGKHIATLRDRYRNATRFKFLDSVADLDILVLALELQASIITADEGVLLWARRFGALEIAPHVLMTHLESLLRSA